MLPCAPVRTVGLLLVGVAAGCAGPRTGATPVRVSGPPGPARESLAISVVYPRATDVIQSRDSSFLFGAVRGGTERAPATLSVAGQPVPVLANGAWIAWVPLPDDTVAPLRLVVRSGGDSAVQDVMARIAPRYRPPPSRAMDRHHDLCPL